MALMGRVSLGHYDSVRSALLEQRPLVWDRPGWAELPGWPRCSGLGCGACPWLSYPPLRCAPGWVVISCGGRWKVEGGKCFSWASPVGFDRGRFQCHDRPTCLPPTLTANRNVLAAIPHRCTAAPGTIGLRSNDSCPARGILTHASNQHGWYLLFGTLLTTSI